MSTAEHGDYYGETDDAEISITIATADRSWTLKGNADECLGARVSYALSMLEGLGFKRANYVRKVPA